MDTSKAAASAPPELDLNYISKPENYEGSSLTTINRFVHIVHKGERESLTPRQQTEKEQRLNTLLSRYQHVATDEHDSVDFPAAKPNTHALHTDTENSPKHIKEQKPNGNKRNSLTVPHHHTLRPSSIAKKSDSNLLSLKQRSSTAHALRSTSGIDPEATCYYSSDDDDVSDRLRLGSIGSRHSSDVQVSIGTGGPFRTSATNSLAQMTTGRLNYILAREKFRHSIKIVLILLKWVSTLREREDEEGNLTGGGKTFTDIAAEAFEAVKVQTNNNIAFDVTQFKAKKEISISTEVKNILSIPSDSRTPEQLQTVLFGLQHLKSFAEYPLHMQEKLCKVAWFQEVPHKKVIIRQGHYAENFYFILSGQALVRILEKNPKTGEISLRTAGVMRKGTSFGELALLHRSRRTATVVSQESVQLLSIGREDFLDIFMDRTGPDEIPEHIQFMKSLSFLRDWPVELLIDEPEQCLFHFFKRGAVIVKDSNESDWLYIVKTGSCQVMKRLREARPSLDKNKSPSGSLSARDWKGRPVSRFNNLYDPSPVIESRSSRKLKVIKIPGPVFDAMHEYDTNENNKMVITHESSAPRLEEEAAIPTVTRDSSASTSQKQPGFSQSKFNMFPKSKTLDHIEISSNSSKNKTTSRGVISRSATFRSKNKGSVETGTQDDNEPGHIFVQVDKLKPRDVFGLSSVHFDDPVDDPGTSVSLISCGAECIMLSKKFFISHSTEVTKKTVRHLAHPYPSEETLQENLQTKVDWDIYKQKLIKQTMAVISKDKVTLTLPAIK